MKIRNTYQISDEDLQFIRGKLDEARKVYNRINVIYMTHTTYQDISIGLDAISTELDNYIVPTVCSEYKRIQKLLTVYASVVALWTTIKRRRSEITQGDFKRLEDAIKSVLELLTYNYENP